MSYSNYSSQKSGCGCGGWIAIILILLVVAGIYSAVRFPINKNNYLKAHESYLRFDCERAIESYDSVVDAWQVFDFGDYVALASQERAECQAFQAGVEKQGSGDPGGAILAYSDFTSNYANSPLAAEASQRIESLFLETNMDRLASEGFCDQVARLEQSNLIPQRDQMLPNLLDKCGHEYEELQRYSNAISMYEKFLSDYPAHPLASEAEDALARAIVADARATGAGTIPPPQRSGSTTGGSTVVVIQNDSPERLRLVFSGSDSRIEELAACSSCTTYTNIGPLYCPEKGPIGRYTLPPGNYDVVVQAVSDTGVTPWTGDWDLMDGDEYYSCFFITVTTLP